MVTEMFENCERMGANLMLWLSLLFMLFVQNILRQEMKLKFLSTEYHFRSGSIIVFCSDIPLQDTLTPPKNVQDVNIVSLANGVSEKVVLSGPGIFTIILQNVEVIRIRDNKQFQVTHFLVKGFEITEQNLKSGFVEIPISARGAYRIIALDWNGKPVPGATISLHNIEETIEFKTNKGGEIILLGDPNNYNNIGMLPQGPSIWWKILPL